MDSYPCNIVTFYLQDVKCGLPLEAINQAIPIVMITPLPNAPEHVAGTINYHGIVIPVFDIRQLLRLQKREYHHSQLLLVCKTQNRTIAIIVDDVEDVELIDPNTIQKSSSLLHDLPMLAGVVKTSDGLVLIYDINHFLTLEEEAKLSSELKGIKPNE